MSKYLIFRLLGWKDMADGDIADSLNNSAAVTGLDIGTFFDEAMSGGAVLAELAPLYQLDTYVADTKQAFADGDLRSIGRLVAVGAVLGSWGEKTSSAVQAVVVEHTITAAQANWDAEWGEMPTIDAAWVTATLTEAGYSWSGSAWVRE